MIEFVRQPSTECCSNGAIDTAGKVNFFHGSDLHPVDPWRMFVGQKALRPIAPISSRYFLRSALPRSSPTHAVHCDTRP